MRQGLVRTHSIYTTWRVYRRGIIYHGAEREGYNWLASKRAIARALAYAVSRMTGDAPSRPRIRDLICEVELSLDCPI